MSSETRRSLPRTLAKLVLNHRGYRKAWPRERFFLRAKRHTPVVAVDAGGARYFVSTSDEAVGLGIFAHGSHERDQLEAVSAVLTGWLGDSHPLRGKRFLDIGANIGTSVVEALVALGCSGGWALEPHPGNFKLLRHNLLENGLDDKVEALEMAVSDEDGTATLEVAKVNMGDHRVRVGESDGGRMAEGKRETIDVPMRSLDSLVGDGMVSLDEVALAWVDTQGHEAHVLAGATCLAEARVPAYIEYWPYALARAGGLDRLHDIIQGEWSQVADIGFGDADANLRPAAEIGAVAASYDAADPHAATNLLLLPG
ncbi:MAG TPA: FkbM family methyltransferase [Solirubrobacterales bacterium]|nr:FkbM family methyltransferase [Solirubrobacterales bacterium]